MNAQQRAPGWQIRCRKCGFTEPWGKHGIRLHAIGTSYTFGRCPKCRRFGWAVIEKVTDAPNTTAPDSPDPSVAS